MYNLQKLWETNRPLTTFPVFQYADTTLRHHNKQLSVSLRVVGYLCTATTQKVNMTRQQCCIPASMHTHMTTAPEQKAAMDILAENTMETLPF